MWLLRSNNKRLYNALEHAINKQASKQTTSNKQQATSNRQASKQVSKQAINK